MPRIFKKMSEKGGLPPGALVYIGEQKVEEVVITLFDYDRERYEEKELKSVEECFPYKDTPTVSWINIAGIHQVEIMEKIGNHFGIHPLAIEDILNTGHRPKMDDMDDYLFIVLKMLNYNEEDDEIDAEQVSIIIGQNFVISFQEKEGDVFEPVRERIRKNRGRIRKMGADYLAYALLDSIVDNYFTILEKIGERIESLEEELVENPSTQTLQEIHSLKSGMIFLRKSVWPLREVISELERGESPLIKETTVIYLRDVYDHSIQVIDTVETFRDMISGMLDVYLSSISNKMNEVMKVLTIIATIFIPLTFLAGVYGMNFKYMPELEWYQGYFAVLCVMVIIGIGMVIYFRKKKWL
ncbi:MAG TPA: magnesium/cobalt transporter CorA [Candidatus Bathyarchaeia archaeon]|nr:magnesium/cobalt transporter CorA [Candidatus Bathyarchaeia archaeon]